MRNAYYRAMKFTFKHIDNIVGRFYCWCSRKYMHYDVLAVPSKKEIKLRNEWWEKFREENGL